MMDRRLFLGSVALLVGSACSGGSNLQAHPAAARQTYVLIHGAWHGGWCWRDVKDQLQDAGHDVYAPTLTGLGERSHLNHIDVNLTTHTTDIINLIEFENLDDVILVAHSYAGFVASLVADKIKDKIRHIVYLDAAIPKNGQSFFPEDRQPALREKYKDNVLPVGSLKFLGIAEDHPKANWVKNKLTPHPLGTMLEKVIYENDGPAGRPKTFIRAKANPRYISGDPVLDMVSENPEWTYKLVDSGHDVMITAPEALVEILLDIK